MHTRLVMVTGRGEDNKGRTPRNKECTSTGILNFSTLKYVFLEQEESLRETECERCIELERDDCLIINCGRCFVGIKGQRMGHGLAGLAVN